ncbi:hypothetical protein N0V93_005986 [Gnomoniopsis smithogilvyi]|uniref:ABC transporter n=1 Tax=Gnomoniopsis smithogilvyi TaxID=1191159 RepID=A0A9W8YQU1_9PEZI|nr:hypothetical protein N0V93_005986 [Gnomoniopsis smithogilvyi]
MATTCQSDDGFGPAVPVGIWQAGQSIFLAKQVNAVLLLCSKIALLVIASSASHTSTAAIVATVLETLAAALISPLSWLEHRHTKRPSICLFSYLLLTTIFDVVRCRSFWLAASTHGNITDATSAAFTVALVFRANLLVLESQGKPCSKAALTELRSCSPEEEAGIFSLGLIWWLNSLLLLGSRQSLGLEDLYALDRALECAPGDARDVPSQIGEKQRRATVTETKEKPKPRVQAAFRLLARGVGLSAAFPVIPRLFLIGFTVAQSLVVKRVLIQLSSESVAASNQDSTKYGLIGATCLVYLGIASSSSFFGYLHERTLTKLRGHLIQQTYIHSIHLPSTAAGPPQGLTIVTSDVENIYNGLRNVHEAWAGLVQMALALWLTYLEIGLACLGALATILVSCVAIALLSPRTVARQREWMKLLESRVGQTSHIIRSLKGLRMSGLAETSVPILQSARDREIQGGAYFRVLVSISATISQCPAVLAPVVVLATGSRSLNTATAFTTLSYLGMMTQPLATMIQTIPMVLASLVCLQRIDLFLSTPVHQDIRHLGPSHIDNNLAVCFDNASFGWGVGANRKVVLHNVNIQLSKSCLAVVTGPVGCGKSTLLQAVLGEVAASQGMVAINAHCMAYCAQVPYLFKQTIRQNIIGSTPFDPERYHDVVEASALLLDFKQLPLGDGTQLNSGGQSLSGGQRQRISLARALYHPADLLVMDDVLSGLDKETESWIICHVFGPHGLLASRGATALISGSSEKLTELADLAITITKDGEVATRVIIKTVWSDSLFKDRKVKELGVDKKSVIVEATLPVSQAVSNCEFKSKTGQHQINSAKNNTGSDGRIWLHYFSSVGWLNIAMLIITAASFGASTTYPTVWLEKWTDNSDFEVHSFSYYMSVYGGLAAGSLGSSLCIGVLVLVRFASNAGTTLHKNALHTIMSATTRYLTTTEIGTIITHFSQDMAIVDGMLAGCLINLIAAIVITLGQAALLVVSSAWLAISFPILGVGMYFIRRLYLPTAMRLRVLDLEAKGPLVSHLLSTLSCPSTIRAFGWTSAEVKRNQELLDQSQQPSYLLGITQQWLLLVANLAITGLALALTSLALFLSPRAGTVGVVGVGLLTLTSFGRNLADIMKAYTLVETALGAIARLKTFSETTPLERKLGKDKDIIGLDELWPNKGAIQINRLSASYDGSDTLGSRLAVKDISLSIQPGEKVAICGRTGSGKSSVVMLLLGFLDPTSDSDGATGSTITIDRVSITKLTRNTLNSRIIALPQDAVFLPSGSSIRQNLDVSGRADEELCLSALDAVGLLSTLVTNLDAPLDQSSLSQGQRQLFCLARCILRRRIKLKQCECLGSQEGGLLLLDEATAHLDDSTSDKVDEIISREFENYTVVAVTHSTRNMHLFTRVVTIDDGRVVEKAT